MCRAACQPDAALAVAALHEHAVRIIVAAALKLHTVADKTYLIGDADIIVIAVIFRRDNIAYLRRQPAYPAHHRYPVIIVIDDGNIADIALYSDCFAVKGSELIIDKMGVQRIMHYARREEQ